MNEDQIPRSGCDFRRSTSCKQRYASSCKMLCLQDDKLSHSSYGNGKVLYYIRLTENWLVTSVGRTCNSLDSAFQYIAHRLYPLRKGVQFDIFFLGPSHSIRFIRVQDKYKSSCVMKNETVSLYMYFMPLRKRYLSFLFRAILGSHHLSVRSHTYGTYRNSEPEQVQNKGFGDYRSRLAADL